MILHGARREGDFESHHASVHGDGIEKYTCTYFGAESRAWQSLECTCPDGGLTGQCGDLKNKIKFQPWDCRKDDDCDPDLCMCDGCSAFGAMTEGGWITEKKCVCKNAKLQSETGGCGSLENKAEFKSEDCTDESGCNPAQCQCGNAEDPGCAFFHARRMLWKEDNMNCKCSGWATRLQGVCGPLLGQAKFPSNKCHLKHGCDSTKCKCEKVAQVIGGRGGAYSNGFRTRLAGKTKININSTAVNFCYALMKLGTGLEMLSNGRLNHKGAVNYCRERLASKEGLHHYWDDSKKQSHEIEQVDAPRLERLNEVEGGATKGPDHSEARGAWQEALKHVCLDECVDLVTVLSGTTTKYTIMTDAQATIPLQKSCATRVVRKVEANILGCCARSCGWDSETSTCTLWPFMSKSAQEAWDAECCSQLTIMKHSDRELMCNSILNRSQEKEMDAGDTDQHTNSQADALTDGEDMPVYWTKDGVTSWIGKVMSAKEGHAVNQWLLRLEDNITVKQGKQDGYWTTRGLQFHTSLLQGELASGAQCSEEGLRNCHKDLYSSYVIACAEEGKWSQYSSDDSDAFEKTCAANPIKESISLPRCREEAKGKPAYWNPNSEQCHIYQSSCLSQIESNPGSKAPKPRQKRRRPSMKQIKNEIVFYSAGDTQ